MARTGLWRRMVVAVACVGGVLAAPSGAMALSTHSKTATVPNSAGVLVATAKCGANEHVISGGFRSPRDSSSAAIVSRALHGNSWTVHLYPEAAPLTAYAYCAPNGQLSISSHAQKVTSSVEGANTSATPSCGSGEEVVSGGYVMKPAVATGANSPTYQDYAPTADNWTVMSVFDAPPGNLVAFAYCARGTMVKVRSSSSAAIGHHIGGSATASCHAGETLLSGGYTTTPTPDWHNTTGPDFFYGASYRSGARSWSARAYNYSKVAGMITAFVYCKP